MWVGFGCPSEVGGRSLQGKGSRRVRFPDGRAPPLVALALYLGRDCDVSGESLTERAEAFLHPPRGSEQVEGDVQNLNVQEPDPARAFQAFFRAVT